MLSFYGYSFVFSVLVWSVVRSRLLFVSSRRFRRRRKKRQERTTDQTRTEKTKLTTIMRTTVCAKIKELSKYCLLHMILLFLSCYDIKIQCSLWSHERKFMWPSLLHCLFFHDPPFSGAQKVMTLPHFSPPPPPPCYFLTRPWDRYNRIILV